MESSCCRLLNCSLQIYTLKLFFTGSSVIPFMEVVKGTKKNNICFLFFFFLSLADFKAVLVFTNVKLTKGQIEKRKYIPK